MLTRLTILILVFFLNRASAGTVCPPLSSPLTLQQLSSVKLLSKNAALTPKQLLRIQQLTTAYENSDTVFHYDYIEDIKDGRGYTAGRVGFCSGTSDLLEVVEDYTQREPNNILAKYLPELRRLDKLSGTPAAGDTTGLKGLIDDWKTAAKDPIFKKTQDDVVKSLYLQPALDHAKALGLKTALATGEIYDAIIQHGDGTDPDGLKTLIQKTTTKMHGTPASGVDEKQWIAEFMTIRRADLAHCHDVASRKEWAESVDRVDSYRRIMVTGNWNLDGPIHFSAYGGNFTIP